MSIPTYWQKLASVMNVWCAQIKVCELCPSSLVRSCSILKIFMLICNSSFQQPQFAPINTLIHPSFSHPLQPIVTHVWPYLLSSTAKDNGQHAITGNFLGMRIECFRNDLMANMLRVGNRSDRVSLEAVSDGLLNGWLERLLHGILDGLLDKLLYGLLTRLRYRLHDGLLSDCLTDCWTDCWMDYAMNCWTGLLDWLLDELLDGSLVWLLKGLPAGLLDRLLTQRIAAQITQYTNTLKLYADGCLFLPNYSYIHSHSLHSKLHCISTIDR